jgi:VanZ family protein
MPSTGKRCSRLSNGRSTRSSDLPSAASPGELGTLQRWLPVVVWAAFISWFSTDAFSARSTNSYIDPVLRFLFGDLAPASFRFAHSIVRKSAHLIEYAILGGLTCRALTTPGARVPRSMIARTLVYCAVYALLDEAHQAFVPSRTASGIDVMIDITGATTGTMLLTCWRVMRTTRVEAA